MISVIDFHIYSFSIINYSTLITSWGSSFRRTFIDIDLCICKHMHLFFFFLSAPPQTFPRFYSQHLLIMTHWREDQHPTLSHYSAITMVTSAIHVQEQEISCKKLVRTHTENVKILSALEMQHSSLSKGDVIYNCVELTHTKRELS